MKTKIRVFVSILASFAMVMMAISAINPVEVKGAGAKVGLVLDSPIDDAAWGQMAHLGLLKAQTDFGITPGEYIAGGSVTPSDALNACYSAGNLLCVGVGYSLNEPIYSAASAHPGVNNATIDVDVPEDAPDNLRGIRFREKEVGYLAGALAGKMTSTHIVGEIGGIPVPAVVAFTTGFRNGAQCTDNTIIVLEEYSNDFGNPTHGAEIAESMINNGADVVFAAAGPTGNGAILYTGQHDKLAIGVDHDQYYTVFGGGIVDGSDKLLSSAMKRVDTAVYLTIDDFLHSSDAWGEQQEYGLEQDGVGLAPFHETDGIIPPTVKTYINDVRQKIIDEQIFIDDPCAISVWHHYPEGSPHETALLENIAAIQAADPTLPRIIATSRPDESIFGDSIGHGWGPDMYISSNDRLTQWIDQGFVYPMNIGPTDFEHVFPYAVAGVTGNDGKIYGVPESSKAVGLYYNKTVISTPPATTGELQTMLTTGGKKLTANGNGAGSYYFYPFWHAFGGQLLNDSGLCIADQGGFVEAMQYLVDLKDTGNAQLLLEYAEANVEFTEARADMIINGPWELGQFKDALGTNLGVSLIPNGAYGAQPLTGIDAIFINGKLPSPDWVMAILENVALSLANQSSSQNMTDDAMQIPVRDDVTVSDPLIMKFKEIASEGDSTPRSWAMENYWEPFNSNIEGILTYGNPAKGVDQACKSMNNLNDFPRLSGNVGEDNVRLNYTGGRTFSHDGGIYEFYVVQNWTGKITPVLSGFSFSPVSRTISTPVTSDLTGLNFTPSNKPGVFYKTSPANNAVNQPPKITLKWGTSINSTSYEYCLQKGSGSGTTCSTGWKSTGTNKYVTRTGLTAGSWFWQVRAKNSKGYTYANNGAWWKLTIPPKPGAFSKVSPLNNAIKQPTALALKWGTSTNAAKYEYCIDTTAGTTCTTSWKSTNLNKFVNLTGLLKGKKYYWMVRAVNAMGTTLSNAGVWWNFTTKP